MTTPTNNPDLLRAALRETEACLEMGDVFPGLLKVVKRALAAHEMSDAYAGAREDLAIWKKRALKAEALNRKFIADINGPTFVGEPATPAPVAEPRRDAGRYACVRNNLCDSESTLLEDPFALAGCVGRFPDGPEFDSVVDAIVAAIAREKAK